MQPPSEKSVPGALEADWAAFNRWTLAEAVSKAVQGIRRPESDHLNHQSRREILQNGRKTMSNETGPYTVEEDKAACPCCHDGSTWTVCYGGFGNGREFEEREDAEDLCEELNESRHPHECPGNQNPCPTCGKTWEFECSWADGSVTYTVAPSKTVSLQDFTASIWWTQRQDVGTGTAPRRPRVTACSPCREREWTRWY